MTVVRLWQAHCPADRVEQAVTWVQQRVAAEALEAGAHTAEVFRGGDTVLLLTRWPTASAWVEPTSGEGLVERCTVQVLESVGDR